MRVGDLSSPEAAHALSTFPQFETALRPHSRAYRVCLRAREARSLADIQELDAPAPDETGKCADGIFDLAAELRKWPVRELVACFSFIKILRGDVSSAASLLAKLVIATGCDPEALCGIAQSAWLWQFMEPHDMPTHALKTIWSPVHRLPVEYRAQALMGIGEGMSTFSETEFGARYREHLDAWKDLAHRSPDKVRPHLTEIRQLHANFQDPLDFPGAGLKQMPPDFWQETSRRIDVLFDMAGSAN